MRRRRHSSAQLVRTRLPAALAVALFAAVVMVAGPAEADTLQRSWIARLGTGGANGNVEVLIRPAVTARVAIGLRGLPAATLVSVTIRRGTCAAQGAVLAALPHRRTTAGGRVSNIHGLTVREASAIAGAPSMVATIRAGSFARCALLVEQITPPAPTPTTAPSPKPTGTPRPVQLGVKFISGGTNAFWVSAEKVVNTTAPDGGNAVVVTVGIEAGAGSATVRSTDFWLEIPGGMTRITDPAVATRWSLRIEEGESSLGILGFVAPATGSLDLRFRSVVIHIRD